VRGPPLTAVRIADRSNCDTESKGWAGMTNFDVNLSILFTELPLHRRPAAARAAGFDAVELCLAPASPG
jgi:hypothetical protein